MQIKVASRAWFTEIPLARFLRSIFLFWSCLPLLALRLSLAVRRSSIVDRTCAIRCAPHNSCCIAPCRMSIDVPRETKGTCSFSAECLMFCTCRSMQNARCSACKNRAESICIRRMANLRGTHDVLQAARNEFEFTLRNGNTELHPPRYASSLYRYIFVKASHEPVPFFRIYTIYFRKSFSILHFQIYTIYFRKNVRLEKCEYILYIPEYIPLPLRTVVESLIEREIDAST